jgi:hypothetical protein
MKVMKALKVPLCALVILYVASYYLYLKIIFIEYHPLLHPGSYFH